MVGNFSTNHNIFRNVELAMVLWYNLNIPIAHKPKKRIKQKGQKLNAVFPSDVALLEECLTPPKSIKNQ
jgi:hypothetical protein